MDTVLGISIVIATVAGPIAAVLITRRIDKERDQRRRREEVFRLLMRSRRNILSQDYVVGLNMVEIEFHGDGKVIGALKALLDHLGVAHPATADWLDRRQRLATKLLSAMATSLGYRMDQLEVLEGGYRPQGWDTVESEQQELRQLLIALLSSRRSLQITPVAGTPAPPVVYPPAPTTS
jgi:hypothetical protein